MANQEFDRSAEKLLASITISVPAARVIKEAKEPIETARKRVRNRNRPVKVDVFSNTPPTGQEEVLQPPTPILDKPQRRSYNSLLYPLYTAGVESIYLGSALAFRDYKHAAIEGSLFVLYMARKTITAVKQVRR